MQRKPRLTRRTHASRREQIADWIENSPTKKIVVAVAAMFAFALSLANVAWSAYKEYEQFKLKVVIEIRSRTSYPLQAPVSMDQLFGHSFPNESGNLKPAPKIEMPYYPIVLSVYNPTAKKSTLSDCLLKIHFYEREGEHESEGYVTAEALKSPTLQETPVMAIESGATARVEWLFFFLPDPAFQQLLADRSTQAFRFQVRCRDEANQNIISAWR